MIEKAERGKRKRIGLFAALGVVVLLLAIVVVPPMVSIRRYKNRIANLVSLSMGRPVHLSSVELRLLPRPAFVMTDLSVDEDPAYGAEPILHANSVTAAIRLLSLWRGRLEISQISVDEASLNLLRNGQGNWNFDALLRPVTAQSDRAAQDPAPPFPYLEATNSRINLKNGIEKLPYSLVNADISFWQQNPNDWRLRLRGQPARTDVSLDLADTGIVRLEARLRPAPGAEHTSVHIDLEWREAQLGQLSRLVLGSDPGWRGNLTGALELDGTTESAQVKTRLSASGVHRAEFAPADALDFDANCSFVYRYSARAVDNLACDSPFGDGHIDVRGDLPETGQGKLTVALQSVPVSAGLDALRTLRSGIDESIEVRGTVSGQLTYSSNAESAPPPPKPAARVRSGRKQSPKTPAPSRPSPVQGSLTIEDFKLSGNGFSQPIQVAKVSVEPSMVESGQPQALVATFSLPAGGETPLGISIGIATDSYRFTAHGASSFARLRELAHIAGVGDISSLDGLAGDPATLDLAASGPWLAPPPILLAESETTQGPQPTPNSAKEDHLSGVITLHNANWKSDALASLVQIPQATLHFDSDELAWDPVSFSYGLVKGTAALRIPQHCNPDAECNPQLDLRFASLDAASLQEALLGARRPDTVLSSLIARISPSSSPPAWPKISGSLQADSLLLGPVKLRHADFDWTIAQAGAELTHIEAELLGGTVEGSGKIANGVKPSYEFEGSLAALDGPDVCELLALHCTEGEVAGRGKIELTGFSDRELAASAKGTLHFEWRHGGFDPSSADDLPKELTRFDRLAGDATIANNGAIIQKGQVALGEHKSPLDATVIFANPPAVAFGETPSSQAAQQ
jgi:hypothetical protein